MDIKRDFVVDLAKNGHNIILTGQAGTGKSFLIKEIADVLKEKKTVHICASTGIATLQFAFAQTLHSWSGIKECYSEIHLHVHHQNWKEKFGTD